MREKVPWGSNAWPPVAGVNYPGSALLCRVSILALPVGNVKYKQERKSEIEENQK
jgi:hypothetical protein